MSNIPLVDLKAQLPEIEEEVRAAWDDILRNTAFILGGHVQRFEEAFSSFSGVAHTIGVANGTDALEIAFRALGIGRRDEVIVPANTFIATALAAARAGADVVLVDVDERHQLIDPSAIEARITERTKAIAPVHLFGQMAPMKEVLAIAERGGLHVVEDLAQAQGAKQGGRGAGTFGAIGGTSFYPGKNLGAFGDAGAVVTPSDALAKKARALRNYGSEVKYHHPETGFNSRLDPLQAAVLSAKLKRLDRWNEARRAAARRYDAMLDGFSSIGRPATMQDNEHVWHLYVIRVQERDRVLASLNQAGIGAGIHYPVPIHLQGAFAHLGHARGDFPVAERLADEILSLPLFPEITEAQQARVVEGLRQAGLD
ncbi:MAG: DegT/DnrJ/EryC1/StrS family aminotransferase [Sandaracinaceae bacterium]